MGPSRLLRDAGGDGGVVVASRSAHVASRSLRLIVALVVVAALTACGFRSGGDDEVWLPHCRQVWVTGATLPADYIGCQTGVVGWSPAQFPTACVSGSVLYYYDQHDWAWPGQRVRVLQGDAADDPAYRTAWRRCRGIE